MLFAGTNDIAGAKPKSAHQVFDGYRAFVKSVHAALPATPIHVPSWLKTRRLQRRDESRLDFYK